jgi:glyoxylase-like metal-dependent hydrolase (beta-lactamase superfamily II)
MKTIVRVNGRGNAWPVLIGRKHPLYSFTNPVELSNSSYSIISYNDKLAAYEEIEWEILIDAGNNIVPYLINHENRIPDALFITHGHHDHTSGIEWIAQSYYSLHKRKYPVYCTFHVWETIIRAFPHLGIMMENKELLPGVKIQVNEIAGLSVTSFPVFHGEGALGASMLLFESSGNDMKPVLFTGDVLCPLFRKKDADLIKTACSVYIDSNNRFPYPSTNHISFIRNAPGSKEDSRFLKEWIEKAKLSYLISPQLRVNYKREVHEYFDEFLSDWKKVDDLPLCILDFVKFSGINLIHLIHYSGLYDSIHYDQEILDALSLENWAHNRAIENDLMSTVFSVPEIGNCLDLSLD